MSTTEELRAYLGRLLGWSNTGGIDHALRSIEFARERRAQLVDRLRGSDNVQYICLEEDSLRWLVWPGPIEVPDIAARASDLSRIVDEYVFDAIVELAPAPRSLVLTERDRQWLIENAATTSLSEIEKATLRLVALRTSANLSRAAARLGMATVSLSRWVARRKIPTLPSVADAA
jgi:hypothetical protein